MLLIAILNGFLDGLLVRLLHFFRISLRKGCFSKESLTLGSKMADQ